MIILIEWVVSDKKPNRLIAAVSSGPYANEAQRLCQWPTNRLLWRDNGSSFDRVNDQKSIESWPDEFPAFTVRIY